MELMNCSSLAVPDDVMQHVVHVESSYNPYAIGVVGGKLARQPRNLAEALATVRMLEGLIPTNEPSKLVRTCRRVRASSLSVTAVRAAVGASLSVATTPGISLPDTDTAMCRRSMPRCGTLQSPAAKAHPSK
jgi:hypothetical protein